MACESAQSSASKTLLLTNNETLAKRNAELTLENAKLTSEKFELHKRAANAEMQLRQVKHYIASMFSEVSQKVVNVLYQLPADDTCLTYAKEEKKQTKVNSTYCINSEKNESGIAVQRNSQECATSSQSSPLADDTNTAGNCSIRTLRKSIVQARKSLTESMPLADPDTALITNSPNADKDSSPIIQSSCRKIWLSPLMEDAEDVSYVKPSISTLTVPVSPLTGCGMVTQRRRYMKCENSSEEISTLENRKRNKSNATSSVCTTPANCSVVNSPENPSQSKSKRPRTKSAQPDLITTAVDNDSSHISSHNKLTFEPCNASTPFEEIQNKSNANQKKKRKKKKQSSSRTSQLSVVLKRVSLVRRRSSESPNRKSDNKTDKALSPLKESKKTERPRRNQARVYYKED